MPPASPGVRGERARGWGLLRLRAYPPLPGSPPISPTSGRSLLDLVAGSGCARWAGRLSCLRLPTWLIRSAYSSAPRSRCAPELAQPGAASVLCRWVAGFRCAPGLGQLRAASVLPPRRRLFCPPSPLACFGRLVPAAPAAFSPRHPIRSSLARTLGVPRAGVLAVRAACPANRLPAPPLAPAVHPELAQTSGARHAHRPRRPTSPAPSHPTSSPSRPPSARPEHRRSPGGTRADFVWFLPSGWMSTLG